MSNSQVFYHFNLTMHTFMHKYIPKQASAPIVNKQMITQIEQEIRKYDEYNQGMVQAEYISLILIDLDIISNWLHRFST